MWPRSARRLAFTLATCVAVASSALPPHAGAQTSQEDRGRSAQPQSGGADAAGRGADAGLGEGALLTSVLSATTQAGTYSQNGTNGQTGPFGLIGPNGTRSSRGPLEPFGSSLFQTGGTQPSSNRSLNPNYLIQSGDSVEVQLWGGVTAQSSSTVDPDGNIFLPNFGPIHVAGVSAAGLQGAVQHAIGNAFTNNVQIYAVLQGVHQIDVFVTGFVKFPGRYSGSAVSSALDYLVQAGGVDPNRGSYRDITLRRDGRDVAKIDLYGFLLDGKALPIDLHEGDTLVVGKQLPMIGAQGSVRNNYLFEVPQSPSLGSTLLDLARPLPAATNASLVGTRNGQPFELYVPVSQLASTPLYDQDQLTFVDDAPLKTVAVQIQGSRIGPSQLVADNHARLNDVLNYVEVDPRLANTKAVYILRQGLAAAQRKAITDAADRLEKALFLAISATTGESQIRTAEAQLVAEYIKNARQIVPEGRLVATDENGNLADIRLVDSDVIVIPEKTQVIMVTGEVVYPQAVIYGPNKKALDYIASAGGFTERGTEGTYMIRRANGQIVLKPDEPLYPGDELIALPFVAPKYFQVGRDILQSAFELAIAAYATKSY